MFGEGGVDKHRRARPFKFERQRQKEIKHPGIMAQSPSFSHLPRNFLLITASRSHVTPPIPVLQT